MRLKINLKILTLDLIQIGLNLVYEKKPNPWIKLDMFDIKSNLSSNNLSQLNTTMRGGRWKFFEYKGR